MELTREDYAEAFGVELPAEGQQTQTTENGAQSPQEGQTGEGTLGDAGGSENAAQGTTEPGTAENGGDAAGNGQQRTEMSTEERHRQAAARRAREDEARQAAEQMRRDQIYADLFRGQVSPYTGKPITTEAEFKEYQAEKTRRDQAAQLQRAGIEQGTIQDIVRQEMAPVQENLQKMQMNAMMDRAKQVQAAAEREIESQLKLVAVLDPSIKSLDDIVAMPTGQAFSAYVEKGLTIEEAFRLANGKEIEARKIAAAQAAARNQTAGKGHLDPVQSSGGPEPVEVPAAAKAAYLEMMPGATDAEIRAAYAKYLKETKR